MMRVKIRLYRVHDYDLVCLYKTVGPREFSHMVKDILRCYIQQIPYGTAGIKVNAFMGEAAPVTCHLQLEDRLVEEIGLLQRVQDYKRPAFIKMILRAYLMDILAPVYFSDLLENAAASPPSPMRQQPQKALAPTPAMQAAAPAGRIAPAVTPEDPAAHCAPRVLPPETVKGTETVRQAKCPAAVAAWVLPAGEEGERQEREAMLPGSGREAAMPPLKPAETPGHVVAPAGTEDKEDKMESGAGEGDNQVSDDIGDLAELFGGMKFE